MTARAKKQPQHTEPVAISSATIFDALGFGRGILPPRPVAIRQPIAKCIEQHVWCSCCERSVARAVTIVPKAKERAMVRVCDECVKELVETLK